MDEILYPAQREYLKNLRKEDDTLILQMEEYAKQNRVPILDQQSVQFLEQLVMIQRPKRVLEIGTAIAYSSIRIARRLRKNSTLYTIEKSEDNLKLAKNNIAAAALEDKINLIFGDALEVMPNFDKKFDLIFLDADKEDYQELFDLAQSLLRKNGIIFVDNLLWHGYTAAIEVPDNYKNSTDHIRKFNKMFMTQEGLFTNILPIGDGIGLAVRIKRGE